MKYVLYSLLALLLAGCSPGNSPGHELDSYLGRWLIVNYWAEWCKPCIGEIPELNTLAQDYPQISVVGVNYDGATGEDLQRQVEKLGIAFPLLAQDPSAHFGIPRPSVLPTTLVIDPRGQLITALVGPQTAESLARATGQIEADE